MMLTAIQHLYLSILVSTSVSFQRPESRVRGLPVRPIAILKELNLFLALNHGEREHN